jgi:hypothetical protein
MITLMVAVMNLHSQVALFYQLKGSNFRQDDRPGTHWVALYIDANPRGEYYDPTGRPSFLRAYVNFMNKHCTSWTYNTIRVQEEGSTVWSGSAFPTKAEGTFNLLGSLFLAYTPLKTLLILGCVFSTWSITKVFI